MRYAIAILVIVVAFCIFRVQAVHRRCIAFGPVAICGDR